MKIAIVQSGPVYLDLQASLVRALSILEEAAKGGADLTVFGESWFSGYPIWLDISPEAAVWDHPTSKAVFRRMYENGLDASGPEMQSLRDFAKQHQMIICFGANETVKTGPGNGSIYNALIIIGADGELAVHHRKVMPTHGERLVHAPGDGHGLQAIDTEHGRIGGLICWEHWMPLTRQAMHDSGEHLHLALWPHVKKLNQMASRHYAFEGRCYVVAVGQVMRAGELPEEMPAPGKQSNDILMRGGSCIFGPNGEVILEPQYDIEGLIWAEIPDLKQVIAERMALDVTGHYQRRDLFDFGVKRERE